CRIGARPLRATGRVVSHCFFAQRGRSRNTRPRAGHFLPSVASGNCRILSLSSSGYRMIAWTIYLTFAGAVVLLVFPGVVARWIALLTAIAGLVLDIVALVCTPVADLAHFMTIVSVPWVPP